MKNFLQLLFIILITSCANKSVKPTSEALLKTIEVKIDSIYKKNLNTNGLLVHIEAPDKNISWTKAVGYSNKTTKTPINKNQPALIASNTKTYVAVAILRLIELKKLQLNESIVNVLTTETKKALTNFGYNLNKITIKQLLSHTSGIKDYVNDAYFEYIDKNKKHRWTRNEQIQLATSKGKPLAEPGALHFYADINYLLLSEIIENKTNKPFYTAIRELLKFKALELNNTWFYTLEETPKNSLPLLHQYRTSKHWDSYDFDPSWDLYGGGGLASTIQDLALFFQYLFEGKIIADKNLLNELTTIVKAEKNNNYALGIRNIKPFNMQAYYHGGYWGTDVAYIRDLNTTVAIFNLERDERYLAGRAINPSILKALKEDKEKI